MHVVAQGEHVLAVPVEHADDARTELEGYAEENASWPPVRTAPQVLASGKGAALAWTAILSLLFVLQSGDGLGIDWHGLGVGDADAVRDGELWRTVTPLTLHADLEHLASNLVFGALFVAFTTHLLGNGVGMLALLLSGVFGNVLGVVLRGGPHLWVGASTSVFGAVGLITGFLWVDRRRKQFSAAYVLAPIVCGLLFLGMHGMGNLTLETLEQGVTDGTDVLAHATGFVAGLALGGVLAARATRSLAKPRVQRTAAIAAGALLATAWSVALAFG